jgi:omega-6 fatty acid desaturase (delta-12 desaturase)
MNFMPPTTPGATSAVCARDWLPVVARYREPDQVRSVIEMIVTAAPFLVLWLGAWWALSVNVWISLAIAVPAAAFLVRFFMIQHDCGHGAFFRRRGVNDWVGRIIGVVTLTPYDVWRQSHAVHHATSGNLGKRGTGDIDTLTVREYLALPGWRRLAYRAYRHPVVMFGVGPAYHFLLRNRLPVGLMGAGWRYWASAMGTNVAIALAAGVLIYLMGAAPFLLVHLPIVLMASSIGVWLFYVQHQFEDTFWAEPEAWDLPDAALYGSSHYDLPGVLGWLTANIGVHHVHHLCSRIPYYRLPQVLRDHPELGLVRRLTFRQSLRCVKLRLWDESQRKLVPIAVARRMQAA